MIISSRHEAGPLAVLEAAVKGVPTVGTAVGHIAEWAPQRGSFRACRGPGRSGARDGRSDGRRGSAFAHRPRGAAPGHPGGCRLHGAKLSGDLRDSHGPQRCWIVTHLRGLLPSRLAKVRPVARPARVDAAARRAREGGTALNYRPDIDGLTRPGGGTGCRLSRLSEISHRRLRWRRRLLRHLRLSDHAARSERPAHRDVQSDRVLSAPGAAHRAGSARGRDGLLHLRLVVAAAQRVAIAWQIRQVVRAVPCEPVLRANGRLLRPGRGIESASAPLVVGGGGAILSGLAGAADSGR